ncbi:HDOD domain-containing protein [Nitrosomonas sp. Is35]|uniref:HDOD domain-containing protein n=1 Tax=unclassified Nitrosomonas TaxID=2609265 RepID=UPI00294AFBDD|nr:MULTISPECIES: HDOD domain-containing protein [unclassified Nitrosomonas]MDV6342269.1 HDOD domain-containing protein [Nitrosomonas sp. Is24]MDV6348174.1 HDOD domain-containing protein [Nitrosomonas sp. Is35]
MTESAPELENSKDRFFALLTKRMSEKGDFPAFAKSVQHLDELMHDQNKNIADIARVILNDFTLTQKVIRLANSAMYSGMGGEITTITQAAVVLGIDTIAHITLSIRFIDTLSASAPVSDEARRELAKAILAGNIVRNVVTKMNMVNGEEAVVCALLHHLGRLMLVFYLPDEWSRIQEIAQGNVISENDAAREVTGASVDEISQEIARNWCLPKKISHCMISSANFTEISIPGSSDWLKVMANFASGVALLLAHQCNEDDLKQYVSRYSESLLISTEDLAESVDLAQQTAAEFSGIPESGKSIGKPDDSRERLAVSIRELKMALAQGTDFNVVLSMTLESLYVSMGFNRVITFFRDAGMLKAKVGFGSGVPEVLPGLIFPEAYAADVFHLSLANKADVFIQDVASTRSSSSIPAWLRETLPDVDAFILLPLVFNGKAIGLIYADWCAGTTSRIEPSELSSMGVLRDYLMRALIKRK